MEARERPGGCQEGGRMVQLRGTESSDTDTDVDVRRWEKEEGKESSQSLAMSLGLGPVGAFILSQILLPLASHILCISFFMY